MEKAKVYCLSLLLVCSAFLSLLTVGCGDKITLDPNNDNSSFNFGKAVFQISKNYLSQTPPQKSLKSQAMEGHREAFVDSVNAMVPPSVSQNVTAPLKIILPLVDDGTLPQTTDDLRELLQLLLKHPQDPAGDTLKALATLANEKGLSIQDWTNLIGRVVQYGELEKFLQSASQLIKENDGVDNQGNPNNERDLVSDVLAFLSRKLKERKPKPQGAITAGSSSSSPFDLTDDLLSPVTVRGSMGAVAYSVKLDKNGNPAVATNPATGTLYYPYVDQNGDGVADTDSYGRPIDQQGKVIELNPFGKKGSRNAHGLALATSGSPIFQYFDAKKTLLGSLMQLVGVAVKKKVPAHGVALLKPLLGSPITNDNGTPLDPKDDYKTYSPDQAFHDLLYGILELFKDSSSPKLLDSLRDLTQNNPKTTEDLLISIGKAVDILNNTSFTLSKADLYKLIEDMIPLLEEVFKKSSASSQSTARVLFQTINDIGQSARDLPSQLAVLIRYKGLQPKVLVDFSQPGGTSNRSSLEQLLALLDSMDQCTVPIINQTLTYITLDMMAGMTPQSVKNLVLKLDGLLSLTAPLINFLCPGFTANRKSLNDLALSGALDAFLPITKVFKDRGELRLLINILRRLYASYPTLMRNAEPTLAKILESGAVQNLFDVLSITTKLQVPGSTEKVADVLADSFLALLDSSKAVYDRKGKRVTRLFDLLYFPAKNLENQISQAGKSQDLTDLVSAMLDYITQRVKNDNGTPLDPSDDYEQLKYPNLIPLLMKASARLNQYIGTQVTNRVQKLQGYQQDLATFMGGRDFYSLVDFMSALENSTAKDGIYKALTTLFTPQANPKDDSFGALASVMASLLQIKSDARSVDQMAWFMGDALDPKKSYVKHGVRALNRLMEEDKGKVVLTMVRNTFAPDPKGLHQEPIIEIYRTMQDVYKASQGNPSTPLQWTSKDVQDLIQGVLKFMNDKNTGIDKLYELIRKRKKTR